MSNFFQRQFIQITTIFKTTSRYFLAVVVLISFCSTNYALETQVSHLSALTSSTQSKLKNIISDFSHSKPQETCLTLVRLRKDLEMELFKKSCPTDSEIAFSFCQQRTDALSPDETRKLQNLLAEIDSLNDVHCLKSAAL